MRFAGVDTILGPEMKSTGEVMGIDQSFPMAFAKAELAAATDLPLNGLIFVSVRDSDKPALEPLARGLAGMGFGLVATGGTARDIQRFGIECTAVHKVTDGGPNVLDLMHDGRIAAVINTPDEEGTADSFLIRRTALELKVPFFTTIAGAQAAIEAIAALRVNPFSARALQDYHRGESHD